MGPDVYFIHSAALSGVYLSHCMYMSPTLIRINTVTTKHDSYNLQRTTGVRPVPPVQPHDIWLLNPYMVTDRAAFGS